MGKIKLLVGGVKRLMGNVLRIVLSYVVGGLMENIAQAPPTGAVIYADVIQLVLRVLRIKSEKRTSKY